MAYVRKATRELLDRQAEQRLAERERHAAALEAAVAAVGPRQRPSG